MKIGEYGSSRGIAGRTRRDTATALILALLGLGGCSSDPGSTAPSPTLDVPPPPCQAGCQETDPFPSSPGIFLSSSTTPSACEEGNINDSDVDGLSDDCEARIAAAFAPELYTAGLLDNTGRESRWVARPLSTGIIRIMYLLSYYHDNGTTDALCSFKPSKCAPHVGDSELIILDVRYDIETQHWVLSNAIYSEHDGFGTYSSFGADYPAVLFYPVKPGGYPRSYVAIGKHANYATVSECNAGGFLGLDDCSNANTASRVAVGVTLNLGSNAHHGGIGQNCVVSLNPSYFYYGSGKTECYWTGARFRGWVPDSVPGDDADPYGPKLLYWGF